MGMESNRSVREFADIATKPFRMIEVALVGGMSEMREQHNWFSKVEADKGDHPLACTNQRLVASNVIRATQGAGIQFRMIIFSEG